MNKAALKRLALEIRAELDVDTHGPFDPYLLADLYGIDVHRLTDASSSPEAQAHFRDNNLSAFSGALIPLGTGAIILDNDHHDIRRRRVTIAHEMAHVVQEHRFMRTLVNEDGCRTADRAQEEEATELSAELLLPADAARTLAAHKVTDDQVAEIHVISVAMARWRMNATGARMIAKRSEAKRR